MLLKEIIVNVNKVLITWLSDGIVYNNETWLITSISNKKKLVKYILAYFHIIEYYAIIIIL